jgi:serine/threonine protein kinase
VKAWRGQGGYGAVYRAERVGFRRSQPGALKVSLLQWNWRMQREVELLSRLNHPGIPRLLDRGGPRPASGDEYPFFVMEWVEGTPLYVWAEQHVPSGPRLCRVLARLARALEAVHAEGAVHRDVKGDNILVRVSDGLPVLLDFGSCHFLGAPRITWQSLAPFTPEYLSPQAWSFTARLEHDRDSYYPPSPADDLYALGVTAYRLVMGEYPPPIPNPRALLESNPRVEPRLREVILQLLSEAPEARGTAAQVAQALEAVAAPASESPRPQSARPPARTWTWEPWLALAAVGLCAVLLWTVRPAPFPPEHLASGPRQSSASQAPDAGTAAVGEAAPTEPQAPAPPSAEKKPLAQEPLPEPRPGQARPDKKGRCPGSKQVPINGGCWGEMLQLSTEECAENGYVPFKGKCYTPAFAPPQKPQPTSDPTEAR